jgi:hypothetical protein
MVLLPVFFHVCSGDFCTYGDSVGGDALFEEALMQLFTFAKGITEKAPWLVGIDMKESIIPPRQLVFQQWSLHSAWSDVGVE